MSDHVAVREVDDREGEAGLVFQIFFEYFVRRHRGVEVVRGDFMGRDENVGFAFERRTASSVEKLCYVGEFFRFCHVELPYSVFFKDFTEKSARFVVFEEDGSREFGIVARHRGELDSFGKVRFEGVERLVRKGPRELLGPIGPKVEEDEGFVFFHASGVREANRFQEFVGNAVFVVFFYVFQRGFIDCRNGSND